MQLGIDIIQNICEGIVFKNFLNLKHNFHRTNLESSNFMSFLFEFGIIGFIITILLENITYLHIGISNKVNFYLKIV
jgi:hypothetical protein